MNIQKELRKNALIKMTQFFSPKCENKKKNSQNSCA